MHVDANAKFSCWFFSRTPLAEDWPDDAAIADGSFAARQVDINPGDHWVNWLGSFIVDEMRAGGLVLYTTAASNTPKVLDGENEALKARSNDLLNGLLIQGIPIYQRLLMFSGANVEGDIEVRQYAGGKDVIPTWEIDDFVPGRAEAERMARIATRLRHIQNAGGEWGRLLRTTRVLLDANRIDNAHGERFHEFVRVLDGLVKTRQGRGATDFAHRVQAFAVASPETWATLVEIYDLRGAVEHLNSLLEAVSIPAEVAGAAIGQYRIDRVNQLTRRLDALVRFVLVQIFERDDLFEVFRTEEGIDAFWHLGDRERVAAWGRRLDIRRLP